MRIKNLTEEQVIIIIKLYVDDKLSTITIGKRFNIDKKSINNLLCKNNVIIRKQNDTKYKGGKTVSNKKYREKEGQSDKQKTYMETYYPKYYGQNKDELKDKFKNYYYENHAEQKLRKKTYDENNKDKIKIYRENYKPIRNEKHKERIVNDSLYKVTCNIRSLIKKGFKNSSYIKNSKTQQILGCSFEEFKLHLESKFEHWMTWENMGNPKDGIYELNKTWDIDHIIPSSSATTEDEIIRLNHYTNLQPLCSYVNRFIKRDKY